MSALDQGSPSLGKGTAVAVLLIVVIGGAAAAFLAYSGPGKASPSPATAVTPAPPTAPPPTVTPQLMSTPGKAVAVKLTALGDNGTWYMIDEDICEGDAALTAMLQDRIARDKAARGNPAGYSYPVTFVVEPGTGIGDAHVAAARKAAEAAGASVLPPPDRSKETVK
jgi:hypothetical protein